MLEFTGDFSGNHVDEDYMKGSSFGWRIADGALMGMGEASVSVGCDGVRFLKAVFIGDTVTVNYSIAEVDTTARRSRSKIEVTNQHGEAVAVAEHILEWAKNQSASSAAGAA